MVYESFLVVALLLIATGLFVAVFGDSRSPPLRTVLQLHLLVTVGVYFVWNWSRGRQTLPMRTWRLRLIDRHGAPPGYRTATVRYVAALIGLALFGTGILWALIDPERRFLHDRIAGTRLVGDPWARGR